MRIAGDAPTTIIVSDYCNQRVSHLMQTNTDCNKNPTTRIGTKHKITAHILIQTYVKEISYLIRWSKL